MQFRSLGSIVVIWRRDSGAKPARQDADEIMTSFVPAAVSLLLGDDCHDDGRIKGDWATIGGPQAARSRGRRRRQRCPGQLLGEPGRSTTTPVACLPTNAGRARPSKAAVAVAVADSAAIGLAFNPSNNLRTNVDRGCPDVSRVYR